MLVCIRVATFSVIKVCNYLLLTALISLTFLPSLMAWLHSSPDKAGLALSLIGLAFFTCAAMLWRAFCGRNVSKVKCKFEFTGGILTVLRQSGNSGYFPKIGNSAALSIESHYKILPSSRVSPCALFLKLQAIDRDLASDESTSIRVESMLLSRRCISKRTYRAFACSIFRSQQKDRVSK